MTTDVVVRVLAVVGGGVGGGLAMGLLAQLFLRAMTIRKPPRWSVLTVRLLGGAICGWLVALWLFGGGGPSIGGTGGWGLGAGKGNGTNLEEKPQETIDQKSKGGGRQTPAGETIHIEVLGKAALSEAEIGSQRWYRIETANESRLLTLGEVKAAIEKRQHEQPPLRRIEIVLYKNSPDEHVPIVSQLRMWAGDQNGGKMKVDILRPDSDAPKP